MSTLKRAEEEYGKAGLIAWPRGFLAPDPQPSESSFYLGPTQSTQPQESVRPTRPPAPMPIITEREGDQSEDSNADQGQVSSKHRRGHSRSHSKPHSTSRSQSDRDYSKPKKQVASIKPPSLRTR